jgi:ABC-2 type transport system permease protein
LDAVATQFVSSLDTLKNDISKTPLLMTSEKSKLVNAPTRVSLNILRFPPDERQYSKGRIINGVLLEGEFQSAFKNRISPEISENPIFKYKEKSAPNKMIVFSSSSLVKNEVDTLRQKYFDLGYYKYTRTVYANKELVMNAVNYLMDDSGLINARSKKFKIRLLDRPEITRNRRTLQAMNTFIPVVLISLLALIAALLRRNRYRIQ